MDFSTEALLLPATDIKTARPGKVLVVLFVDISSHDLYGKEVVSKQITGSYS